MQRHTNDIEKKRSRPKSVKTQDSKHIKVNRKEDVVELRVTEESKGCFGTNDEDLITNTLRQVLRSVEMDSSMEDSQIDHRIRANYVAISEMKPNDALELLLVSQMVAVHNMAMVMSQRAMSSNQTVEGVNYNINRVTKLMRTFAAQVEALNKYRNKGKQQITVKHQNVNVNEGGQAVIGDIGGGGNE